MSQIFQLEWIVLNVAVGQNLFAMINDHSESMKSVAHPVKIDLNKKLDSKEKTIQTFNIDAKGFRKTRNENPLTPEIGVTS